MEEAIKIVVIIIAIMAVVLIILYMFSGTYGRAGETFDVIRNWANSIIMPG